MKKSEKGIFKLIETENRKPKIAFEPINGTVWIHKSELPELFGVYQQTINACIDSIFKAKLFREEEVSKYDLYTSGSSIKYNMQEFRLEVIVAIAFHLNSPNAKMIREWFVSSMLQAHYTTFPIFNENQDLSLN